jgi:hypothetical protein
MFEYTLNMQEGLIAGLRSSIHNLKNKGSLVQADGVIKEGGELFNLDDLDTFDISTIEVCDHPFPQKFQLRNWNILCTPTKIYTFNGTTLTSVYTALEGSTWTVADFYDFLVLTNGRELVTLNPVTGVWSKYVECSIPYCLCVCDVNGQLFVGGPECAVSAGWLGE